jgi:hypothetical protein
MKLRVKRAYGTPWSKLVGEGTVIGREELEILGKIMLESVVAEAKKDYARQGNKRTPRGQPEGIPGPAGFPTHTTRITPEFFKSFDYEIVGKSTVAITSTWPWIEQITEGRRPFKMTWLTQARGVKAVPIVTHSGQIVVRMAPFSTADAWIHPGFARHTFIQRGIRKGRKKAAQVVAKMIAKKLAKGNPLR